ASLLSLAQRRLSTQVRRVRRKAIEVSGSLRYRDGTTERLDRRALIAAPEAGLRLLWLAMVALSIGALLSRWSGYALALDSDGVLGMPGSPANGQRVVPVRPCRPHR